MYSRIAVLVCLALAASTFAHADELEAITPPTLVEPEALAEPAAPPEVLPLYSDRNRRMTVFVRISDKGPYSFIVDTGSQGTVLAREIASQLALREGKPMTVHTMALSKPVPTAVIPHLAANKLVVRKITAPLLGRFNIGADGVLGLDALQSQRMMLDFETDKMTLTPSIAPQDKWEGETIVVTARSRLGQLILTDASIGGERVVVIIDTGGEVSVGNVALRQRLQAQHAIGGWTKVHLLDAAGGVTEADYTTVDHLKVARLDFHNLPMAFGDAHMFEVLDLAKVPAVLLGMDALQLFGRVSIDFGNRKVSFQRVEETAETAAPSDGNLQ